MAAQPEATAGGRHAAAAHWRGHLLLFDRRPPAAYEPRKGLRLLLLFVVLEGILGPRLTLLSWLGLPAPPLWLRVPLLLGLALLGVRFGAGLKLAEIGLYRWREWSATEKSYFVQVLILANVVFALLFGGPLQKALSQPDLLERVWTVFLPYLLWGFYQELVYRGILQTELVRRWGPLRGIAVSNALFTFGPLHFYHFSHTSPALPMFAGIFAIGLYFAVLFWRSGNLWMVGLFHGIGDLYIEGSSQALAAGTGATG